MNYIEYPKEDFNHLAYMNGLCNALLGPMGRGEYANSQRPQGLYANTTPFGMRPKPRHIQLLEEAKQRHPEWQVKRIPKDES